MNRDEGSYQLSHIYDILFAPKLSGKRRLDMSACRSSAVITNAHL